MITFAYFALHILLNAAQALWDLIPYVLVGTILGEGLRFMRWTQLLTTRARQKPLRSILYAVMIGAISPLCTYGTIPVVLQLARAGMPVYLLISFLVSSTMLNPQLFIMIWGGIGLDFALIRTAIALLFAIFAGVISHLLPKKWLLKEKILSEASDDEINPESFSWKRYAINVLKSLEYVGFYIVMGVIIGSMIEMLVPGQVTQQLFKAGTLQSILLASLISIPAYVCGGGAVPLIHSLMDTGLGKGAAAAFFNVGSATRIQSLMALSALFRPICLVIYVVLLILFSLVTGLIIQ